MGKTRTTLIEGKEKDAQKVAASAKKAKKTQVTRGIFTIRSNFNNTIISFSDVQGNVLAFSSCGNAGFKNTRKGTPYAAAKAVDILLAKLNAFEIGEVKIIVRGIGPGRESAVRSLFSSNLNIQSIEDKTPVAFGGSTPKKPRKV